MKVVTNVRLNVAAKLQYEP